MIKHADGSNRRIEQTFTDRTAKMFLRLKGKIQAYSDAVNAGTIICEDEKIYLFSRKNWESFSEPQIDEDVTFLAEGNVARSITAGPDG